VSGEVAKPGSYTVPTDGASVATILTEAGGPTARAALTRAQIVHKGQTTDVNLRPMMSHAGDPGGTARLVAGDVLLIPTNTAQIAVMGEIHSPNVYPIPDGDGLPVITALAEAGGTTPDGDRKSIYIVRRGADGKRVATTINVEDMLKGSTGNYLLQPDDILYVPSRKKGHSAADLLGLLGPIGIVTNLLK
ncbi:MAG: SLBB domain-containing protein, partial [Armatimonadetes bacterium]|nr:SLBB domain-containing protein [Armatimonadota bacterium]